MEIENIINNGNKYIASVIFAAYVVIFAFLLPQGFRVEEIIDTSTENHEQNEQEHPNEKNNYYIEGVPILNQFPELPTGCEVTTAAMLLNFSGVNVSKETLADEVLKAPLPAFNNGRVEGLSPKEYFIGNPRDSKAFGAFNEPIYNMISSYTEAENMTGCEFAQVLEQIKLGKPVMVWITRDLAPVQYSSSWQVNDEVFWWPKGEHTVVITGIENNEIIANDPYGGEEKRFDFEKFKNIWETMGKQAIVVYQ